MNARVSISVVTVPNVSTVSGECMMVLSNSFGLWMSPELEMLHAHNPEFRERFMREIAMRDPATMVFDIESTATTRRKGVKRVVFSIDDDHPAESFVRMYSRGIGAANQEGTDSLVIPAYKWEDTVEEYRTRVSQLFMALLAYRENILTKHVRRIHIVTETEEVADLALNSMRRLRPSGSRPRSHIF